jgi:drug/metabolite transporter (DMT)-like permease
MTYDGSPNRQFTASIIALLLASALSSLGWVFEGEAIDRLAPLPVVCISLLSGGAVQLVIGLLTGGKNPLSLAQATCPRFILFSVLRSAIFSLLFAYCLTLTSSTKTMFLTKVEPYIVLAIQIIWYGHRTTLSHIALLAVHILGALLLSTGGHLSLSRDAFGDVLLLVAVTGHASLYLPAQRYSHSMGSLYASGFSQLYGGIALLPFMLATSLDYFVATPTHISGWYYTSLTIVVFYVLSTGLWFFSLKDIPAWLASALRSFGPVFAAPIAWLWFNKGLSLLQTFGAGIVVITSAWMVVLESKNGQGAPRLPRQERDQTAAN